ncbi:MAG: hypothetical protein GC192_15010 [Bacteroidetes bacterium]|nr:hypothetical protein [Bacteroidota bacterium]
MFLRKSQVNDHLLVPPNSAWVAFVTLHFNSTTLQVEKLPYLFPTPYLRPMRKLCHILFLYGGLLVWSATGFAQEKQLLSVERFDENKGLNLNGIDDIFQDREGFLWLATPEGLVRFDGHDFRYFRHVPGDSTTIGGNHVLCVTEDADGNIWAGLTRGGVCRYDRKTGRFRNYEFTEKLKIKTTPVIRTFIDRKGEVWLGVNNYGLVHLDKETGDFKTYDIVTAQSAPHLTKEEVPNYNTVQNFWEDENGLLYCATSDDLYTFDPKTEKVTSLRYDKRAPNGVRLNQAYALLPEGDWLWVGGWASGLRRFNRKTGEWRQYMMEENPLIPDAVNIISKMVPKSSNEFWVTSTDKGFGVFNKTTEQFYFFGQDTLNYPEIPPAALGGLCIDKQGDIWLIHGAALLRIQLKNRQFHLHPVKSSKPVTKEGSYLTKVFEDREGRFRFYGFAMGDGLQVLDKKTGKTTAPEFKIQPGVDESNQQVRDILQAHDGTIWVLGRHILYRFNPQTLRLEVPPQPPVFSPEFGTNYFNMMAEDGQGNIWMGTAIVGLFRYNPTTGETTHFMPDENKPGAVPASVVGVVCADGSGRLWYASRDKQAYGYYHSVEGRFVYLDANGEVTTELASLRMNNYFSDRKGDMWAFTEQGVMHFDATSEPPCLIKKYTMADGLPSDYTLWGTEDGNGNIWLISGHNIVRLEPTTGKINTFTNQDGYPTSHTGIGTQMDGDIFLPTYKGYITFNPDSLRTTMTKAPLVLTSFKVNDEEQYHGSSRAFEKPLVVPTDGRYFSLEFASLEFAHPELSRFEYQLEGLDKQWVKAGNRRLVNYTNVPAGHYIFLVKLEGQPDSEAFAVPLVVKVAFYKTNWFWALITMILAGVVFAYFRNRQLQRQKMSELLGKAQLLEKEKALVQYESLKQQLNPHFLFNSLTSLGSLISIDPKGAATFLDSLSKTYRYILKSSERETVPLAEELKFGETFVKLQKTRFGEGLRVNLNVDEADFHRKIVPVTLQNLIENAIKHNIIDEEEPLEIDVTVEGGYLVVRNNLQKKKFVETSNKRGLSNLQSFYNYLSDKPIVVEEDEQFFTIKIPLI